MTSSISAKPFSRSDLHLRPSWVKPSFPIAGCFLYVSYVPD